MLTHCGTKDIETSRLYLRPFKYKDDDDMLKYWISDPKIQSMYGEPTYSTKDEVYKLLNKYISSYENNDYYRWAIIEKESEICIGQIAIFLVVSKHHFGEIEYCIGSEFHRKGFATEAVNAILDFGFNRVNFHKIQVSHKENNIASKNVIQKCGFKFEGNFRDYFFVDGKYINRLYYSLLKSEWKNS